MRKKNPVIEKARQEGFKEGFEKGVVASRQQWIKDTLDWFDNLEELTGFGKKRVHQVANHFSNYFNKG